MRPDSPELSTLRLCKLRQHNQFFTEIIAGIDCVYRTEAIAVRDSEISFDRAAVFKICLAYFNRLSSYIDTTLNSQVHLKRSLSYSQFFFKNRYFFEII